MGAGLGVSGRVTGASRVGRSIGGRLADSSWCRWRCRQVASFFFFFQAEDGIRDYKVTGVQTCALPISEQEFDEIVERFHALADESARAEQQAVDDIESAATANRAAAEDLLLRVRALAEIGRASCRERV